MKIVNNLKLLEKDFIEKILQHVDVSLQDVMANVSISNFDIYMDAHSNVCYKIDANLGISFSINRNGELVKEDEKLSPMIPDPPTIDKMTSPSNMSQQVQALPNTSQHAQMPTPSCAPSQDQSLAQSSILHQIQNGVNVGDQFSKIKTASLDRGGTLTPILMNSDDSDDLLSVF